MSKEFHAVLPEYVYEIIMDIVKNNNLSEREKLISEQLINSTDSKIIESLMDDQPSLILSRIAKKAAIEKLSEDEITSLLSEKLRLDKERAEPLTMELKKKLVFFIEVIEIGSEEKEKKESSENNIDDTAKKKEKKAKKIKKDQKDDPYREPVE